MATFYEHDGKYDIFLQNVDIIDYRNFILHSLPV